MTSLVATDVLGPVQAGLYAVLRADEELADLLDHTGGRSGVYDVVPENAGYPLIQIGEPIATAANAHDRFGAEIVVDLHVYIKPGQGATAKTGFPIVGRLRALLDEQTFSVAGHVIVACRHEQTRSLPDPRPEFRHLPVRFRLTTEQE